MGTSGISNSKAFGERERIWRCSAFYVILRALFPNICFEFVCASTSVRGVVPFPLFTGLRRIMVPR